MDTIQQMLQFIADPQNTFWQHTIDTIKLSVAATALALAIGLPLGVLVARRPLLAFLATNLTGLVRAIPTLAVLFVMILVLKQIGFVPSVIALTALGIPPILLNTIAGLRGIDPAAVDAAVGMGMTRRRVLREDRNSPSSCPSLRRACATQRYRSSPQCRLLDSSAAAATETTSLQGCSFSRYLWRWRVPLALPYWQSSPTSAWARSSVPSLPRASALTRHQAMPDAVATLDASPGESISV